MDDINDELFNSFRLAYDAVGDFYFDASEFHRCGTTIEWDFPWTGLGRFMGGILVINVYKILVYNLKRGTSSFG